MSICYYWSPKLGGFYLSHNSKLCSALFPGLLVEQACLCHCCGLCKFTCWGSSKALGKQSKYSFKDVQGLQYFSFNAKRTEVFAPNGEMRLISCLETSPSVCPAVCLKSRTGTETGRDYFSKLLLCFHPISTKPSALERGCGYRSRPPLPH